MYKYSTTYVGMDVHKETIAVGIAKAGRGEPIYYGEIPNTAEAIKNWRERLLVMEGRRHFATKLDHAAMKYIVS